MNALTHEELLVRAGMEFLKHYGISNTEHIPDPDAMFTALATMGETHLAHYGVKGMKWGVRKTDDTGSDLASGDAAPAIAVGAVYAAIILGAMVAQVKDSGKFTQMKNKNTEWKTDPSLIGKKSVDQLFDQVVKPINSNYGSKGTKMNCRRCTLAYEMRRRGMDVKATTSNYATGQDDHGLRAAMSAKGRKFESGWGEKRISHGAEMARMTPEAKANRVFDALGKLPNGSRGELCVGWTMGGGHSVAWEVVNNKPVVFDTQNSTVYRDSKSFAKFTPVVTEAAYTRLDNVVVDDKFIRKWVQNA